MNSTLDYQDFLAAKLAVAPTFGFECGELNPALFPFQAHIVRWALRKGRAAIFADCGLGKTLGELEWSRCVAERTFLPALILCPLAVAAQTEREGVRFGIAVNVCRSQKDVMPGVNVANYEMLKHFDPSAFGGIALDESGILKSFMGATKRMILEMFAETPYRSAWTATPAPNDHLELGNHAEFLGIMPSNEMIMRWFVNDAMQAGGYRLKKHGAADFWRWVCSWAVSVSTPADLGFDDAGYELPPLCILPHIVEAEVAPVGGALIQAGRLSATELHKVGRQTASYRAARAAELVADSPDDSWILWCNTDYEADAIKAAIPAAVDLRGSEKLETKERKLIDFSEGRIKYLISKPKLAGFGLNWQHCHNVAFVGVSYSYEMFYQALRRCWRFGQQNAVTTHVLIAEEEQDLVATIQRKQADHDAMKREMYKAMQTAHVELENTSVIIQSYTPTKKMLLPGWLKSI